MTLQLDEALKDSIGPELLGALEGRGFERLTPVQEAVLQPDLEGRDLRISSQTGSGKTIAIGFAVRDSLEWDEEQAVDNKAHPRAMVIVPTRELAKQVHEELAWLFAAKKVRIASVTGGGGYRDELRSFRQQPAIVVGTPGRLLDHLKRGTIDASSVASVVLDEADRMLDMGFRDDIEAIFGFASEERRTHLVSATFPRDVKYLADRIQTDPAMIEGTPIGSANEDIEHLIHLVNQNDRLAAMINLLLEDVTGQTLIFARTRADVAELTVLLTEAGFSIVMLSGEMEQAERNRALAAFKRGTADALVATDVAARGIDVSDVTRVIHAEPPTDADAYTHRSGRTGRAGKKGISSVLVAPRELHRTTALMQRAKVRFRFAPIPTAESLLESRDGKLFDELTADFVEGQAVEERSLALAERLLAAAEPARAVARLVEAALSRRAEPREVTPIGAPQEREKRERAPTRDGFVRFRVSWGTAYGASVPRVVAMLCRRGGIDGRDIGAINLGKTSTVVDISTRVVDAFERAASKPDPRDPRINIRRWTDEPSREAPAERAPKREAPAERASKRDVDEVPKERPSKRDVAEAPKERPSKRDVAEAPPAPASSKRAPKSAPELPAERPSKRDVASARELPAEKPSKRDVASARELPAEKPSKRDLAAPKSARELPAEKPSKRDLAAAAESTPVVAAKSSRRAVDAAVESTPVVAAKSSKRAVEAAAESAPAAPKPAKAKKAKPEEPKFEPRAAVVRRERAPEPKGDAFPPFKPWKKAADQADTRDDRGPNRGGPRDDRGPNRGAPRDDRGPNRGAPRDDRGPNRGAPRDDRGPNRGAPRDDRGPDRGPSRGGPRDDRGPDRGPSRGGPRDDRGPDRGPSRGGPRDDRGPNRGGPPRDDRGPRDDRRGPPPWERRGPAPGGPARGGNAPPKRGRPR